MLTAPIVEYLLRPPLSSTRKARPAAAIAILVIYFLLLLPVALCFLRLVQTILVNPGYVPRDSRQQRELQVPGLQREYSRRDGTRRVLPVSEEKAKRAPRDQDVERGQLTGQSYAYPSGNLSPDDASALKRGLEAFWTKDVFVCEADGKPIFCSTCQNWKPDRAHHCREVARCVRKMDHSCHVSSFSLPRPYESALYEISHVVQPDL